MKEVVLVLVREVLERPAIGLGQEERREKTGEHEEGKELKDVGDPGVGARLAANVLEPGEADLGDDRTELAGRGADAVRGGPVAGREDLAGDDEGRRVRAKVLEEVLEGGKEWKRAVSGWSCRGKYRRRITHGKAVEDEEALCAVFGAENGVPAETHDAEDGSEHEESQELDALPAESSVDLDSS